MGDLLTVDLSTIAVVTLEGLANNGVQRFQKHCDVVESTYSVGNNVFKAFKWVFGLAGSSHKVRVHATGHGRVLKGSSRDHGLDGE